MTRTVVVTGARGTTGREVVAQLAGRGDTEVRGGSSQDPRDPTTVAFDWRDRSTRPTAVDGRTRSTWHVRTSRTHHGWSRT
jgi:uncharacterized protein YbjT (DUF2867 family)